MGRVTTETTDREATQPDQNEKASQDASLATTAAVGVEHQKDKGERGHFYDPRSGEARDGRPIKPVDFSSIISQAELNVNPIDATVGAFKAIADLVRAIKGPDDVEALASGLDKAGDNLGYAVLKGTGAEGMTGVVGRV